MKDPTGLPLALYHANTTLQARIGELIQHGGQYWLDFGQRLLNEGTLESGVEVQELLRTQDWQKLASLPAEAFWRQLQQRFGDQQAAAQLAVAAQTAFSRGLQDAVRDWQREAVEALDEAGLAFPVNDPDWSRLFSAWEPMLAGLQPVAPTASQATTKAPARKPAAKKAAAKKAAPAKAAAGKPAARKSAKKATNGAARKAAKKAAPARRAAAPARSRR